MKSWPARWRGVRRWGRCSRRWSSSSAPASRPRVLVPSWFTSSSLRRGAALSLACRRRPGSVVVHSGDPLPQLRSGSRLLPCPARRDGGALPPSSNPAQTEAVESGKPQRGWWLGVRASPAWRPFESRPQAARGGLPPVPLAVRRAGQVDPVAAACSCLGCARCGALGSLPTPSVGSSTRRARTGPRRAGRLAGATIPSPALAHRLG
jgi:hypothetical protein